MTWYLLSRYLSTTTKSLHSQECKDPWWQRFCDLWPWLLTFTPFQDSYSMSSLVILAASVFEICCGKTDRHTVNSEY